jgi:hypothetical protein
MEFRDSWRPVGDITYPFLIPHMRIRETDKEGEFGHAVNRVDHV